MNNKHNVNRVIVLDINGEEISTSFANRALKLVYRNKATIVCDEPLTIRLLCATTENDGTKNDK